MKTLLLYIAAWVLMAVLLSCLCPAQTTPLVVSTTVACATSTDGSVVGVLNPLYPPVVAAAFSGTLPAANYFVQIAWYDAAGHMTLVSPEVQRQLSGTGSLSINLPTSGKPSTAVGMKVYIGLTTGSETLQGQTTGAATFTQSTPLANGAAEPTINNTICMIVANDAGWPTGTGYGVAMTTPAGDTVPGWPMQWQLLGPGQTINLGQGFPLYNGTVTYPIPLLARPYNHAAQSISGPLSMTGYNLTQVNALGVGTNVPGWPIDVENGSINTTTGYIFNGGQGVSTNNCLMAGSDPYKTFIPSGSCLTPLNAFYQTLAISSTTKPQEQQLNFIPGPGIAITSTDTPGTSTNITISAPASPHIPTLTWLAPANGTLVSGSNDLAGSVNVTSPGNGGNLFTETFSGTYPTPIFCVISTNGGFATAIYDSQAGSTTINSVSSTAATTSGTGVVNYLCHP